MNLHTATIGINETLSIALWNNWQTILNNEMCLQFVVVVLLLSPDLTPLLSLMVQSLTKLTSFMNLQTHAAVTDYPAKCLLLVFYFCRFCLFVFDVSVETVRTHWSESAVKRNEGRWTVKCGGLAVWRVVLLLDHNQYHIFFCIFHRAAIFQDFKTM